MTMLPSEIKCDDSGFQDITDGLRQTCAMKWIGRGDYGTGMPPCMVHNPALQNVHGKTCAMLWVEMFSHWDREIPGWMVHDPTIQTYGYGYTCAMLWILNTVIQADSPEWMHHDLDFKNYRDETCAMMWNKYRHNEKMPEWMIKKSTD